MTGPVLDMNPGIRARWAAALRSGAIPQAKGRLRAAEGAARCCLGVLCDLAVADGIIPPPVPDGIGRWDYDGEHLTLPESVMSWAGLSERNPAGADPDPGDGEKYGLAEMNDDGCTFAQIADVIDGGVS